MPTPPTCARCAGSLRAPSLMSSAWECERHGPTDPLYAVPRPSPDALRQAATRCAVPLWAPLPMLPGWTLSGFATAGDERAPARATVVALSGPSPLGGPADLLLVAEEPGTGVGARFAGTDGPDPGQPPDGPPDAKLQAAGHPTALWRAPSADDRAAFVGEAMGVWLWAILWPAAAELVLIEEVALDDLRDAQWPLEDLPVGAPSPRLGAT